MVVLLVMGLFACSKKESTPVNTSDVSLSILSPTDGQTFKPGDSIHLLAKIGYNGILHGYEARVTDTASNGVLFDVVEHSHSDSFLIDQYFVVNGTDSLVLLVDVRTEVDHEGNYADKQLYCHYQP